jgi:hypothetical protein
MLQIKLFILNNLIETRKEKDTNKNGLMVIVTSLRERPFNLKGGGVNIRLYNKNSESDYFFFPPPKSEYFLQQHWESEYFFRKKP